MRSLIEGQSPLFTTAIEGIKRGQQAGFVYHGINRSLVEPASEFVRIAGVPTLGGLIYGYNLASIADAILAAGGSGSFRVRSHAGYHGRL